MKTLHSPFQQVTRRHGSPRWPVGVGLLLALAGAQAADTSPAQHLERWSVQAGAPGQAERGRAFFTSRHGAEWSCASCHGHPPTLAGQHAGTGKTLEPLAPAANARAFTEVAKVDKWFRRNCKDVVQRDGRLPAGVRGLPRGLSAGSAAGCLVAAPDARTGHALRCRRLAGPCHREAARHLAAGKCRHRRACGRSAAARPHHPFRLVRAQAPGYRRLGLAPGQCQERGAVRCLPHRG